MTDPGPSYRRDRLSPRERFDEVETTVSHLFRRPHPALGGRSFGAALYDALRTRGLLEAQAVVELGGGAGHLAAAMVERAHDEGRPLAWTFLELSPVLARAQAERVVGARAIRAHAEALPLRSGSVKGLFLANEVIADLRVEDGPEGPHSAGAGVLLEELARVLAPGAAACLTEFGVEGPPQPVALYGARGRGRHVEHTVDFARLAAKAASLGFDVERVLLADLLGFDRTVAVASYPDVLRLRRLVPSLPVLAHPREELERRHPVLTRIFQLEFPAIGSPRFPDPSARGGFCQLFWALLLRRS